MEPLQVLLRLCAATLLGCLIGLNRELCGKPAGMRTHGLVALGAALITVVSLDLAGTDHSAVLRTIQGIMAGIGFLGGGVILRDESHQSIHGLTTAASVWVVASLGIACGAGQWLTSAIAVFITLALLILGEKLEQKLRLKSVPVPREPGASRKPLV
ncbi:MAG: putative Mg2+ transporter-C (MgtC) family protein [Acidobacteriota bacterium]|jgi:putative Mg2+ transporter-C (MgtC) family protein|nr:putative Mg2+ transporter-C (MgtC) family protein [Acidobacteriota bacterium]